MSHPVITKDAVTATCIKEGLLIPCALHFAESARLEVAFCVEEACGFDLALGELDPIESRRVCHWAWKTHDDLPDYTLFGIHLLVVEWLWSRSRDPAQVEHLGSRVWLKGLWLCGDDLARPEKLSCPMQ